MLGAKVKLQRAAAAHLEAVGRLGDTRMRLSALGARFGNWEKKVRAKHEQPGAWREYMQERRAAMADFVDTYEEVRAKREEVDKCSRQMVREMVGAIAVAALFVAGAAAWMMM